MKDTNTPEVKADEAIAGAEVDVEDEDLLREDLTSDESEDEEMDLDANPQAAAEVNQRNVPPEEPDAGYQEFMQGAVGHSREADEGYVTEDTAFVSKNYLGIDPASGLIEVFVSIVKKESFILHRHATIATLKELITQRKGIPPEYQRLIYSGRIMKDHTTLSENKIDCGCSVHMYIPLRGGQENCHNADDIDINV